MIECLINIFCCFFSWSDTWYEASPFLDIISDPFWIEDDHRIKKREDNNECKIHYDCKPSRLLAIDIEVHFNP